ncbi:adenylate/guanylate cyclase domain-containing protein [Pengzhenrongella frigida]|uniref:Adenylate/guanylate cyclase domain-containing protein n=1 Tax=Pengzhenrongella frigida TaxID=1259133 RepID=A0A4Q5N1M8_9MICO|nr:adenylate/guanylate cyclase domain-containing protein [Cellulomonas sp. HLT2-17]RYV52028.1 adenylate/guanylate cyclase domain-containing protein [Cellulomonas sp. HLT2-17]
MTFPTSAVPEPVPPEAGSTVDRLDSLLLGGDRTLTLRDLAARSDPCVAVEDASLFWSTLGLPHADLDDPVFTEDDVAALIRITGLVAAGHLERRTAVTLTRALGHTSERLVLWQVEALVEDTAARFQLDDTSARLVVLDQLAETGPMLEAQLVHSWRRHLAAMAGRIAAEFGEARMADHPDPTALPLARAVGFADMVSFTRRTAGLGPTDLSLFVQRFETAARDVVTAAGGRVVKTIGDAVLFIADDVVTGAHVALGLARVLGSELDVDAERSAGGMAEGARGVTPVRVGFVQGRVLSRFGDVFGASVNVAARLTDIAEPSTVLTDQATAALLAQDPRFALTPQPARDLAGLGSIAPVRVSATT